MKKLIAFLLAALMLLSLCACGEGKKAESDGTTASISNEQADTEELKNDDTVVMYPLGKTVSTDILDFTLENAQFSYYVDELANPSSVDKSGLSNPYTPAKVGQCIVCITFRLKNNDRASIAPSTTKASWKWNWTVNYNGEAYPVSAYNDENDYINLCKTKISTDGSGDSWITLIDGSMMSSGDEWLVRAVGYINVEPTALTDGFELTINLPTSSSEEELFTYSVDGQA